MTNDPNSGADDGLPTIRELLDRENAAFAVMGRLVSQAIGHSFSPKKTAKAILKAPIMGRLTEIQDQIHRLDGPIFRLEQQVDPLADIVEKMCKAKRKGRSFDSPGKVVMDALHTTSDLPCFRAKSRTSG